MHFEIWGGHGPLGPPGSSAYELELALRVEPEFELGILCLSRITVASSPGSCLRAWYTLTEHACIFPQNLGKL